MEVVSCRRHTVVLYFVVALCWFPSTVQPKCNDTENLQEWIDRTNNLQEWIQRTEVIVIDLTINITDSKVRYIYHILPFLGPVFHCYQTGYAFLILPSFFSLALV